MDWFIVPIVPWYINLKLYFKKYRTSTLLDLYIGKTDETLTPAGKYMEVQSFSPACSRNYFPAFYWFTLQWVLFDWSHRFLSANQSFCLQPHTKLRLRVTCSDAIGLQDPVRLCLKEGAALKDVKFKENDLQRHITESLTFSDDAGSRCERAEVVHVLTKGW